MLRAPGGRLAALLAVAALALGGGWLWLRDSFLVSVDQVAVGGLTGSQAPAIRDALIGAARGMTTLHMRHDALLSAISRFPIVRELRVSKSFPHGLRIDVIERRPVAVLAGPGARLPVAADGRLLRGLNPPASTPAIHIRLLPTGASVTDRRAREAVALLAAAPTALRHGVARVTVTPNRVVAVMRSGTTVYFGTTQRAHAKWAAVARVLADPTSSGAAYLDVRLPERPAAGVPGARELYARAQAALQAGGSGLAGNGSSGLSGAPAPAGTGVAGGSSATGGGSAGADGATGTPSAGAARGRRRTSPLP